MSAVATLTIEKTPDVCGGDARVGGTRIPVWLLVAYRRDGLTDRQILEAYPDLTLASLSAAWWYYAKHRDEVGSDTRRQGEE